MAAETQRRLSALFSADPEAQTLLNPRRSLDEASARLQTEGLTSIDSKVVQRSRRASLSSLSPVDATGAHAASDVDFGLSGGESLPSSQCEGGPMSPLASLSAAAVVAASSRQSSVTPKNEPSSSWNEVASRRTSLSSAVSETAALNMSDRMSLLTSCAMAEMERLNESSSEAAVHRDAPDAYPAQDDSDDESRMAEWKSAATTHNTVAEAVF